MSQQVVTTNQIFPYKSGITSGLISFLILFALCFAFPPKSEESFQIRYDWSFYLVEGATIDAFGFVLFSPQETMRTWHNTISLFTLLTGLPLLWWQMNLSFELVISISGISSVLLIGTLVGLFRGYSTSLYKEFQEGFENLSVSLRRGLFPDNSSWFQAARHFAIVITANFLLFTFLSNTPFDFLILLFGVLFEVSISRYCFGQRTAKSDFVNVFAALYPFMEAVCGGLCSRFSLFYEESIQHTQSALFGFFLSEVIGYFCLLAFFKDSPGGNVSKIMGTIFKVCICLFYGGGPQAIPVCKGLVILGNLYVLVLDIFTIEWNLFQQKQKQG